MKSLKRAAAFLAAVIMLISSYKFDIYAIGNDTVEQLEERINYVYVESPYIETGMNQNIVVSYNSEAEKIEEVRLVIQSEDGNVEEWECTQNVENLYLFSKEYTDGDEKASYKALSMKFVEDNVEREVVLTDLNASIEFGVNEVYDGFGKNIFPLEDVDIEGDVSVVTIDENGEIEEQNSIEEALREEVAQNGNIKARANSDVVVALDPGHDVRHAGAAANGLLEHILTLKIANYCKEELETYRGVEVYMTRTTEACPYPETTTSGKCIEQRAIAAAAKGARIYVSFHLNAQDGGTTANGAEVIFPNSNWKEQVGKEGQALAQSIQDELVKLGLKDRGIYTRDTSIGETYEDGSLSDYYAVHIYNKKNGIPGIIVEHAFITNSNDVNNFLKTEDGLKKLGIADATGIANYLGLTRKNESFGEKIETGYYYISSNKDDGYVIDIADASAQENTNVEININSYILSQLFYVESLEDGYYTIQNVKSKKYLTTALTEDGVKANVYQAESTGSNRQKWIIQANKGENYSIISAENGLALDIHFGEMKNGSNVQTYTQNHTEAQNFLFERTDWIEEGLYYIGMSQNKNVVLDIAGASMKDRANLQLYNANKSLAQIFSVEYEEGYYIIRNKKSGKVLDVKFGGTSSGTNVWQYSENGSDAQKWTIKKNTDGSFTIVSAYSGLALDIKNAEVKSGSNVQIYESNNTNAQKFVFTKEGEMIEGRFYICAKQDENYVIDIKHASMQERANVQLYEMNQTLAQAFDITYENGYYIVTNANSGMALDVVFGGSDPGTNVWQYVYNGSDAQKWYIQKNNDGTYTFISKKSGLALDIRNAEVKNGSNIQIYTPNGTDAQRFVLKEFD